MWKPLLLRRLRPVPDLIFPPFCHSGNTLCLCVYLCSHVEKSDDGGEYVYIFQPSDKNLENFALLMENIIYCRTSRVFVFSKGGL